MSIMWRVIHALGKHSWYLYDADDADARYEERRRICRWCGKKQSRVGRRWANERG
jgi:hypothetical protein